MISSPKMPQRTCIIVLGWLVCVLGTSAIDESLVRLADGIFLSPGRAHDGAVSNSGVVILESSILIFDTHYTPDAALRLGDHVREISKLPVKYLVNSHYHADHTHGNQVFQGIPHMIASSSTRQDILEKDLPALLRIQSIAQRQIDQIRRGLAQQTDERARARLRDQLQGLEENLSRMQKLRIFPPLTTFDDRLTIVDGRREIHLMHPGRGHTDGDVIMFLPRDRIVFTGDLFFNRALPNTDDAHILEWMNTISEVLKLEADIFVPGHGAAGTRRDVELFLQYLRDLRQLVESAMLTLDSLEQIVRQAKIPVPYESFSFQNFFPSNVQKMYAELKAVQISAPPEDNGSTRAEAGRETVRP